MHTIEPFYNWLDDYVSSEDERSPFYGQEYDEFQYSEKIYNHYIHPQWDYIGSPTLYLKVLFCDYEKGFNIIELLGEWNDCIHNDIMFLKRDIGEVFMQQGINKFILIGENVLNFHADDDDYYQEWAEEVNERDGWITCLNLREHVVEEMDSIHLHEHIQYGEDLSNVNWRPYKPTHIFQMLDERLTGKPLLIS